jgi:transcriptional regulator with XRE-family HTH domain
MINVAQTTYSDYEKGKIRIPIDIVIKLAEFYDVDMNYITGVSNIKQKFPRNKKRRK